MDYYLDSGPEPTVRQISPPPLINVKVYWVEVLLMITWHDY